jgi:hypothetical protein
MLRIGLAGGIECGESSASQETSKATLQQAAQRFEHYALVTGKDSTLSSWVAAQWGSRTKHLMSIGGSDAELKPVTPEIKTEIPSLKLRRLKEEDAEELLRNDQNRGHLRQWMPWLDETKSAADTLNFIRRSLVGATDGTQYITLFSYMVN